MTDTIHGIKDEVTGCVRCGLSGTRTNAVPGSGNFHSDVVFVGEAPGRNEDACGRPFVGAAGRILSEALEEAGVSRDSVYITNVVKCRPPGNRVPSSAERESCMDYLQREIQIINPRLVCILGNTAFGSILGGTEITKHRGKIIRKDGQLYYITIHPAAAIYRQEMLGTLKSDIAGMFHVITELKKGIPVRVDAEYAA